MERDDDEEMMRQEAAAPKGADKDKDKEARWSFRTEAAKVSLVAAIDVYKPHIAPYRGVTKQWTAVGLALAEEQKDPVTGGMPKPPLAQSMKAEFSRLIKDYKDRRTQGEQQSGGTMVIRPWDSALAAIITVRFQEQFDIF